MVRIAEGRSESVARMRCKTGPTRKINYITDGDIAGALSVIGDNPKNDIYFE